MRGFNLLCCYFSVCLATFPGEWLDENLPELRYISRTGQPHWSLHILLFGGAVDEVSGRPRGIFANRLVLSDQSFVIKSDKPDMVESIRTFRGRNLTAAVLSRADLRKADFTGALLRGAVLDAAKLEKSIFGCARTGKEPPDPTLWHAFHMLPLGSGCARLEGATLDGAQLQGAVFDRARIQRASFRSAQLQGASFFAASLREAVFDDANLQGALLSASEMQGASFLRAELQGASFDLEEMRGDPFVDLPDHGTPVSILNAISTVRDYRRLIRTNPERLKTSPFRRDKESFRPMQR